MNQNEEDRFFEALAGRGKDDPDTARARALRQSIKLRAEVLREVSEMLAEQTRPSEMTEKQKTLFDELKAQKVFADSVTPVPDSRKRESRTAPPLFTLVTEFFSAQWGRPLAFAAMLALVVGVVVQQGGFDQSIDESRIVRGGGHSVQNSGHTLVVRENPSQFVAGLAARLEANGAIVVAPQINEREWNLKVSVPSGVNRASIQAELKNAGFGDVNTEGDIELTVRKP